MTGMRLQVALAKSGVASRRASAKVIASSRVKVNGRLVTEKGFRVDIARDKITLDGNPVLFEEKKHYFILNKAKGVLSTAKDERARKTVLDYVKKRGSRLYPVGRLDKDTRGLIILTNDGELTYRLTHPKFEIDRVYEVKVRGAVRNEGLARLKKGVRLEGKVARATKIILKKRLPRFSVLFVTLREGMKREVRYMFEKIGSDVVELKRISYGPLKLKTLREGEARELTPKELNDLKGCVGIK